MGSGDSDTCKRRLRHYAVASCCAVPGYGRDVNGVCKSPEPMGTVTGHLTAWSEGRNMQRAETGAPGGQEKRETKCRADPGVFRSQR